MFETARLLRNAGYREGSQVSYHRFPSDFVYDGDPSHPESHKAGDVHIYRCWFKNNEREDRHSYEAPLQSDVVVWIIHRYHLLVVVDTVEGGGFVAHIKRIGSTDVVLSSRVQSSYPDAMEAGIYLVLKKRLYLQNAHCSECRFYESCPNAQMYCRYRQKALSAKTKHCAAFGYPDDDSQ